MQWLCGAVIGVLLVVWVMLRIQCGTKYASLRGLSMEGLRLRRLGEPLLLLIEKSGIANHSWLLLVGGGLFSLLSGEQTGIILGAFLAIALPAAMVSDLHKKVRLREQNIMLELPELLNSIVLLVGAGETVQRAIIRCVDSHRGDVNHPLYKELRVMTSEWEGGYSFQQAFENFSKRCAVQEVSLFTTTVLLNYRRGGADFVLSLRDLSRMLWDKRKAISRTRGEQASSKLVFPMVVIFLIVIVLVGTPAFMMLKM